MQPRSVFNPCFPNSHLPHPGTWPQISSVVSVDFSREVGRYVCRRCQHSSTHLSSGQGYCWLCPNFISSQEVRSPWVQAGNKVPLTTPLYTLPNFSPSYQVVAFDSIFMAYPHSLGLLILTSEWITAVFSISHYGETDCGHGQRKPTCPHKDIHDVCRTRDCTQHRILDHLLGWLVPCPYVTGITSAWTAPSLYKVSFRDSLQLISTTSSLGKNS